MTKENDSYKAANEREINPYGADRTVSGVPFVDWKKGKSYLDAIVEELIEKDRMPAALICRVSRENPGFCPPLSSAVRKLVYEYPEICANDVYTGAALAYFLVEDAEREVVGREYNYLMGAIKSRKKMQNLAFSEGISAGRDQGFLEGKGLSVRQRIIDSMKKAYESLVGHNKKKAKLRIQKAEHERDEATQRAMLTEKAHLALQKEYHAAVKKLEDLQTHVDLARKTELTLVKPLVLYDGKPVLKTRANSKEIRRYLSDRKVDERRAARDAIRGLKTDGDDEDAWLARHLNFQVPRNISLECDSEDVQVSQVLGLYQGNRGHKL